MLKDCHTVSVVLAYLLSILGQFCAFGLAKLAHDGRFLCSKGASIYIVGGSLSVCRFRLAKKTIFD